MLRHCTQQSTNHTRQREWAEVEVHDPALNIVATVLEEVRVDCLLLTQSGTKGIARQCQ